MTFEQQRWAVKNVWCVNTIMGNVCCNEFRGWCRAFTRTEMCLSILECVLLGIFTVFLGFTILHFLVCSKKASVLEKELLVDRLPYSKEKLKDKDTLTTVTSTAESITVAPDVQCTWRQAEATEAATHYYELDKMRIETVSTTLTITNVTNTPSVTSSEHIISLDLSEGEDADRAHNQFVLALVKIRPPQDVTFGCILVKITQYWTLTAASCIEAIEEVDSLDSFFMMEGYGELRQGKSHSVADVRMHPLYGGSNRSYDLVALRSEDNLGERGKPVTLPTTLDNYFTVIGEKLSLLGYGPYRNMESRAVGRGLRAASVFVVAAGRCGGGDDTWALRHLTRPRPAPVGRCGARPLCCGPLAALGQPCNYCSGSPLLAPPARLLGLMADNPQCGAACEPALFVNLAAPAVRGWLAAVVAGD